MAFELPIIPLRNDVLFPDIAFPIAVGRKKSIELLSSLENGNDEVVFIKQRDGTDDEPTADDLYDIGTIGKIISSEPLEGRYQIIIKGVQRVRLVDIKKDDPFLLGEFEEVEPEISEDEEGEETQAQFASLKKSAIEAAKKFPDLPAETVTEFENIEDPEKLVYYIAAQMETPNLPEEDYVSKQEILSETDLSEQMKKARKFLNTKVQIAELTEELDRQMREENQETRREYFLRQQLKAIKEQLGEESGDAEDLQERLENTRVPKEVEEAAQKNIDRLRRMQPASSEYGVAHDFVEWLLDFPWYRSTEDRMDLDRADEILEQDHYALDDPKERIRQYLSVRTLKDTMDGPVLCLVGPPGVGKTSLAKSVARALGRKFVRISLGGVKDESEIRGHRRTYVGAVPGRIVQKMERAGTKNPVILLDEVDKLSESMQGDPEAALLEVLDEEQNESFNDHYMDVDIDLSEVLFITTANRLDAISDPLRDRMEVIEVRSYTPEEKTEIAKRHLLPEQIETNGLENDQINLTDEALEMLIDCYTKEAGVRELKRRLGEVCRHVAEEVVRQDTDCVTVDEGYLTDKIGPKEYKRTEAERIDKPGVATGLAYTGSGGDVLFMEASSMSGSGDVTLTGSLGDVMEESAEAAISYLQSHADEYDVDLSFFDENDLHVHAPEGAVPKDGPSAGITIFAAILSLIRGESLDPEIALTGEITLRGEVLKVGGIREKVMAAYRAGIKDIVLPAENEKDLTKITDEAREEIEFHLVSEVDEVVDVIFDD